ncbi:hypothetical protein OC834_001342 [Tilletia horrida]|nr:hypothetical protein OC834_001342 [Tilletia horrida]
MAYDYRRKVKITLDRVRDASMVDGFGTILTQGGHSYLRRGDKAGIVSSQSGKFYIEIDEEEEPQYLDEVPANTLTQQIAPHQVVDPLPTTEQAHARSVHSAEPAFWVEVPANPLSQQAAPPQAACENALPVSEPSIDNPSAPPHTPPQNSVSATLPGLKDNKQSTYAAKHLTLDHAYGDAARRAIRGTPYESMRHWRLADVLIFDKNDPPRLVKRTKSMNKWLTPDKTKQVKELWRCIHCDAKCVVNPNITNNMLTHTRLKCAATKGKAAIEPAQRRQLIES